MGLLAVPANDGFALGVAAPLHGKGELELDHDVSLLCDLWSVLHPDSSKLPVACLAVGRPCGMSRRRRVARPFLAGLLSYTPYTGRRRFDVDGAPCYLAGEPRRMHGSLDF